MDMATFLAVVGIVLAIVVPIVIALWVEARETGASRNRPVRLAGSEFRRVDIRGCPGPQQTASSTTQQAPVTRGGTRLHRGD